VLAAMAELPRTIRASRIACGRLYRSRHSLVTGLSGSPLVMPHADRGRARKDDKVLLVGDARAISRLLRRCAARSMPWRGRARDQEGKGDYS